MKIATAATSKTDLHHVITLYDQIENELGATPNLLILYCSVAQDVPKLFKLLRDRAPDVPLHGGTSCLGVMTQSGNFTENGSGFGMLGISDPGGSYGVGAARIGDDPKQAAQQAVNRALIQADCPGEVPSLVWLSAAPGCEEKLIDGIGETLGKDVPIAGGSTADNSVSGEWMQIANDSLYEDAVVVSTLFPSTEVMMAFHSGYEPTDAKGIITKTGGYIATDAKGVATSANNRLLLEIDGRPAAAVYNEWTDGLIADKLADGGNILSLTTLSPLGRVAGYIGEVAYYQLSHPDAVTSDGALSMFSEIDQGDEIVLMNGTVDSLVSRAGRVAASALETYGSEPGQVAGALLVYCAGCMLTVQERLDQVVASFKESLPDVPFLGTFTFGEQGCFLSGESRHGNLMISVLLFSK